MKRPGVPVILLAGFAPFGGHSSNPSWEAVRPLQGVRLRGHRIVTRCLPVSFAGSSRELRRALRELQPAIVLCVGQAGGRAQLSLERIAINLDDARIPDNDGCSPIDEPVVEGGPAAYFTTLPIKAMRVALQAAGFPAAVSQSAGTYVCNHAFYDALHALRRRPRVRAGFIHIPYSPEQAAHHPGEPSLAIETVSAALRLALRVAIDTPNDACIAAGAEH